MSVNSPTDTSVDIDRLNEKMNPEVKAKWIAALLSGKYKQGKGKLHKIANYLFEKGWKSTGKNAEDAERYCCLGVICELYRQETGKGRWEFVENEGVFTFIDSRGKRTDGMPTDEVMEWAGMPTSALIQLDVKDSKKFNKDEDDEPDPDYVNRDFYLAAQNDEGRTFKTIAKVIEKYL